MKKLLLLLTWAAFYSGLAQSVDFTHLSLDVEFDTTSHEVNGHVNLTFVRRTPVDSIFLNGIKMTYHQVQLNGAEVDYSPNDTGIWLKPKRLEDTNSISISYTARPRKGIYFIGFGKDMAGGQRQIWTQGQGIDHRHWIPHRDDQTDKVVVELKISFDAAYQVIANGKLERKSSAGSGRNLWHYKMEQPMSSYLIAIAIGKYGQRSTESATEVPLTQYYYPLREGDYEHYYYKNEEIFDFLQSEIRVPYPWQNYKQVPVQDFRHGAMENTTATIFGDFFLVDEIAFNDENYTYVNAHELAHQWFGNLVTATGSDHHWLHEGFATYYQWLSERNIYGKKRFDYDRYKAANMIYEASRQDTVPLGNGKAGSTRFYQKGAWVLHMLSRRLGEEDFRKAMEHYLNKHRFGVVNTDSLAVAIKEATGYDATGFLEQWVQRAGEPEVVVRQNQLKDNQLMLEVQQTKGDWGVFDLQAQVELHFTDGSMERHLAEISQERDLVVMDVPAGKQLLFWNWDPENNLLARQQEIKPDSMWASQMSKAGHFLDRLEALEVVDVLPVEDKEQKLIMRIVDEDEHFSVRAAALGQLKSEDPERAEGYFLQALEGDNVQYQKEVLKLVQKADDEIRKILPDLRQAQSYDLRGMAIHLSIDPRSKEGNKWLYDEHWEKEPGIPGHKNLVSVLTYRVAIFKDKDAQAQLIAFTSPAYDFLTRINAIESLAALKMHTQPFVDQLFDALFDPNWKLRSEARPLLRRIYDSEDGRRLIQKHITQNAKNWHEYQKNIVSRTFDLKLQ